MTKRLNIAAKIFGLAIILLLITIVLVVFLVIEIDRGRREMDIVANHDVPLANGAFLLEEFGLRKRLAFERWNGALDSAKPNDSVITESSKNYALFGGQLQEQIRRVRTQLAQYPETSSRLTQVAEAKLLLGQIESGYEIIQRQQQQVLSLQRDDHDKANALLSFLNDHQRTLQGQREALVKTLASASAMAANAAASRQKTVLWLTGLATLSAILLGLLVAALITRHLVIPIRHLVAAVRDVENGKLDVSIPIMSRDEVGQLAGSFNHFVEELRAKESIKQTFGKYIDPRIMEQVLAQGEVTTSVPERRIMTVLFADLVGFTGLSEQLTATRMVDILNRHFALQAGAVHEYHGVVDKFIGDAVMAFWGPPFVPAAEQAALACRAALAQVQAMEVLRRELPEVTGLRKNAPVVDLRIGICTGDVVVGTIGAENTRSYTVMGDSVNIASRLEGVNRFYGTAILISEGTAALLGEEFLVLEIDVIEAKGKSEATRIYELVGLKDAVGSDILQACTLFTAALEHYRAREWATAEAGFQRSLELWPAHASSLLFLERIRGFRDHPPAGDWNGVHQLTQK